MPERVDFYILESADEGDRELVACRLAEKGFQQGLRVFLRTDTAAQAAVINDRLWTFSGPGFVPHELAADSSSEKKDCPAGVLIGAGAAPDDYNELMISLTGQVSEEAAGFQRIADVIINRDDHKQMGRERFRYWRQQGLEPTTHNL